MAIDTDTIKNSLFGSFKQAAKSQVNERESEQEMNERSQVEVMPVAQKQPQEVLHDTANAPKWETLDKVTVLLTSAQKEGLDRIAKKLMKYRSKNAKRQDKERITANTLMRVLIDNLLSAEAMMQEEVLMTEEDVRSWIKQIFK